MKLNLSALMLVYLLLAGDSGVDGDDKNDAHHHRDHGGGEVIGDCATTNTACVNIFDG